jgi:hypothetical protein
MSAWDPGITRHSPFKNGDLMGTLATKKPSDSRIKI